MKQWYQFATFSPDECPEAVMAIPEECHGEGFLYIVLTHSCSVCREDFIQEPFVECIVARPIDEPRPSYLNRKHRRYLDLEININKEKQWYSLKIIDRYFIDRKLLQSKFPSEQAILDKNNQDSLLRWIVHRYNAPAFPDDIDRAITKQLHKKIEKKIRQLKHHDIIMGVYFRLGLPEEEEVLAEMQFLIITEPNLEPAQQQDCMDLRDRIDEIFENKEDTDLVLTSKTQIVAANKLSLTSYRQLHYLDYSSLSEGDFAGEETARPI